MDINICPACGAVYKPKSTDCSNCGAVQARAASTLISTMAGAVAPMVVSVAPDRLILERIVTGRQLNALAPSNYFGDSDSTVQMILPLSFLKPLAVLPAAQMMK